MRNLLIPEFECELRAVALTWAADDAPVDSAVRWTSRLGEFVVCVDLDLTERRCLVPRCRIRSSSGLPSDPAAALACMEEARRVILAAQSALVALGEMRVWSGSAPCDSCSAKGGTQNRPCARCHGTGQRQAASSVGDP